MRCAPLCVVLAVALALPATAAARPGDLDPGFGAAGTLAVPPPAGSAGAVDLRAVAVDGAGRVVASGQSPAPGGAPGTSLVVRATAAGTLDGSFGDGGAFRRQWSTRGMANDSSQAIGVVPLTGGGVLTGVSRLVPRGFDASAARLTDAGAPEVAYGTGGLASVQPPAADASYLTTAFTATPDGSAYVVGAYQPKFSGPLSGALAVVRLTPAGAADPAFGTGGAIVRTYSQVPSSPSSYAYATRLTPAGQLLVGGGTTQADGRQVAYVTRMDAASGFADASFGPEGAVVRLPALSSVSALAVTPDRIYVAGRGTDAMGQLAVTVVALRPDGTPDTDWGPDGTRLLQLSPTGHDSAPTSLAVQPDGRLLVGVTTDREQAVSEGDVLRFGTDGTLDRSFGADGVVRLRLAPTGRTDVSALALDGDRVLIGGRAGSDGLLARMLLADPPQGPGGGGTPPTTTPTTPATSTATTPAPATTTPVSAPGTGPTPVTPPTMAPGATTPGQATTTVRRLRLDARGRVRIALRCSTAGPCAGSIALRARVGPVARATRYGSASYRLAPGARRTLTLPLTRATRSLVTRRGSLRSRLVVARGGTSTTTTAVTLLARRR